MRNEVKETKFETECAVCKQRFTDHVGSTPCCGAIAYLVKDDGTVSDKITVMASINGSPIAPFLIGEQKPTPLSNDLEQAADKPLIELQKELRDLLFVRPFDINSIEKHAIALCDQVVNEYELSTLPDLIKKVLERAAENARIKTDQCDNYWIDKQSILDTKFDDLLK